MKLIPIGFGSYISLARLVAAEAPVIRNDASAATISSAASTGRDRSSSFILCPPFPSKDD